MTISYRALVEVSPLPSLDTTLLFRAASNVSPSAFDAFIENTNKLNQVYLKFAGTGGWMPEIGNLILQGYMSAVESYFRAVVTALINVDEFSQKKVESKTLSFALAKSQKHSHLLPEALMEHVSFATAGSIEKVLSEYLGIGIDAKSHQDVKSVLPIFKSVCQIRHCCVHRFGKLGSQNAMELGFEKHSSAIEQPFSPTESDTEKLADLLQIVVKTLNNFMFREILDRTIAPGPDSQQSWKWTWDYRRDRKRFESYYRIFANSTVEPKTATPSELYASFRTQSAAQVAARASRRSRAG